MAPLVLEGATLGKRHQQYNHLLKNAISNNVQPAKIDYNKTDVENLFNIDIASNNKDVEYILDVLKGDDMLYVSRAIKRSSWLINDDQFAHIIEPEYLHHELFPQMMTKARCKFLLHIRLTLKSESRVEQFYRYFRDKNLPMAFKWLPNCPSSVIEDALENNADDISPNLFKRLCERSDTFLKVLVKANHGCLKKQFETAMFLLCSDAQMYLEALSDTDPYYMPKFGRKHTKIVMENCPDWFIDNFVLVMRHIDLDTFAKYMEKEDIKSFVLKELKNKKVRSFLEQHKLSVFIKYMPKEDKYKFVKLFIEKTNVVTEDGTHECSVLSNDNSFKNYVWYEHAPFIVAFGVLKKIINRESNSDERNAMLMSLIITTRRNLAHIHSLLQYYRKRHINESFRTKVIFVNYLLEKTEPYLYDDKTWTILEEIFRSMEVYRESKNDVQTCIKAIIVHDITRDQVIPDIIEQKFNYDSLKSFAGKLSDSHKEKVFHYLYNFLMRQLNEQDTSNRIEFERYVDTLTQALNLLKDWKNELIDFPAIVSKIKQCVKIKTVNGWGTSLTSLYNVNKQWKKNLFEESLALFSSPIICMNALKHDPELLIRHNDKVEALRFNDTVVMNLVLRKIRVYWPESLATEWESAYREQLDKTIGHKAAIRGLCSLLNQKEFIQLLKKYEPCETKINWADSDDVKLNLPKNIAKLMHIARPQITLDNVLSYAKDDFVQFAQPSVNAVLYNMKSIHSRQSVDKLLNSITILQKYSIHLAFQKLPTSEVRQIFLDVWKSNKNLSVRAVLFQNTHKLLCKKDDETNIEELWELMQILIESLTEEENRVIYNTIGMAAEVHPKIKATFCEKGYRFLKSLPLKIGCHNVVTKIKDEIIATVEEQNSDFVASVILEFVDQILLSKTYTYLRRQDMNLLVNYLLNPNEESTQLERYEKIFVPLMEESLSSWNKTYKDYYFIKRNFGNVIKHLLRNVIRFAFRYDRVTPTTLFRNILSKLEGSIPVTQNYFLLRQLNLAIVFIELLDQNKFNPGPIESNSEMQDLYLKVVTDFGAAVARYLMEDVETFFPPIYKTFGTALNDLMISFSVNPSIIVNYLQHCLACNNSVPTCLLVIYLIKTNHYDCCDKKLNKQIHDVLKSHPSLEVELYYYS